MFKINDNIIKGLFIIFLFNAFSAFSQDWIKKTGGALDDRAFGIVTDNAGNIYTTGYETRPTSGEDIVVIKYNSEGAQQWKRYYNGPGNASDRAFGIVVDRTGNVIVTGYSTGVGSQEDFTTIKYSSSGTQQWVQRYNAPVNGDDKAFGIVVDRVGNIYVTGYIALVGTDIYTIKYNANGVYIWGKVIGGTGNEDDKAFGIVVDSLGNNIYICGHTDNGNSGSDFTVARYDSSGTRIWLDTFNGTGNSDDKAFGIVVDRNENIFVTGYSTGVNSGMDLLTRKYNASGDTLWTSSYNDTTVNGSEKAFGIVVDAFGNSYVTGFTTADTTGSTDYLTLKYNPSGEIVWRSLYDGTGNHQDTAFAICLPRHSEGVYITGGSSTDTIPEKMDVFTLQYDLETGEIIDSSRYNGTDNMNDASTCITSDTSGNVYIAGYTQSIATGYDIFTMRYFGVNSIGINHISAEVPNDFRLYQNYPNPFNPSTKIKFDVKRSSLVKLIIYDMLGRQVAIILNDLLKVGTYEVDLDLPEVSSGIYFYELTSEGYRETMRMALIK